MSWGLSWHLAGVISADAATVWFKIWYSVFRLYCLTQLQLAPEHMQWSFAAWCSEHVGSCLFPAQKFCWELRGASYPSCGLQRPLDIQEETSLSQKLLKEFLRADCSYHKPWKTKIVTPTLVSDMSIGISPHRVPQVLLQREEVPIQHFLPALYYYYILPFLNTQS